MNRFQKHLTLFKQVAQKVPAYRAFLKKQGINAAKVKTKRDFLSLPFTNKNNYIRKYSFPKILWDGKMSEIGHASSGSSGHPTFWFRSGKQEQIGGEIHEKIFKNVLGIKKDEPTLVVICFSMGVWVAGMFTLFACRYLREKKGYNLTIFTPGLEKEDTFNILQEIYPKFKSMVLVGYPPFVMDIVVEAKKRKILLKNNISVLTAGDKFTETWRESLRKLLQQKDKNSIVNVYGSADAGVMGYETPLSMYLRNALAKSKTLRKTLSVSKDTTPSLFQYNPRDIMFEEEAGELVITVDTAVPLIRYNTHDTGTVWNYEHIISALDKAGLKKEAVKNGLKEWKLPTIALNGRTDVAVTFYALNIYPEHLRAGIEDPKVSRFVTGNFLAYNKDIRNNTVQQLCIDLELEEGISLTLRQEKQIGDTIVRKLKEKNIEYRKLCASMEKIALPQFRFYQFGDEKLYERKGGVTV